MRKKPIVFFSLFLAAYGLTAGINIRDFTLAGTFDYRFARGNSLTYMPGINDFPRRPAYFVPGVAVSTGITLFDNLLLNVEAQYLLRGQYTMTDPSDGDQVKVKSYSRGVALLNLAYLFPSGTWSLLLEAGGGVYLVVNAEREYYTSNLGYGVSILPPEQTLGMVLNGGLGVEIKLSGKWAVLSVFRYQYHHGSPEFSGLSLKFGPVCRFH